jgi:hypothetical protein
MCTSGRHRPVELAALQSWLSRRQITVLDNSGLAEPVSFFCLLS